MLDGARKDKSRNRVGTLESGSDKFESGSLRVSSDTPNQLLKQLAQDVGFIARKVKAEWSGTEDEGSENSDGNTSSINPIDTACPAEAIQRDDADDDDDDDDEKKELPPVIHQEVEFQDTGDVQIHSRRWHGPFDLTEARKGRAARAQKTKLKHPSTDHPFAD
ncbi:hypothetical protein PG994_013615 [Apiospora phragmitis]|uniref:Uncharacterized protein n=1 Tax=Apiospora phragmitis TaxID=2905665 RepID=A0ABR1T9Q4_9PEZI